MKRCPVCGVEKPLDQFRPRPDRGIGAVMSRCYDCDRAKSRAYYQANREKKRAYYQANKDRIREQYRKARAAAVKVYGGRCEQCGSDDRLELDHVDWDGAGHRQTETRHALHRRIAQLGRPIEDRRLRLLCAPCHWRRVRPVTCPNCGTVVT